MLTTYRRILDNTRCACDPEQPTWPGTDKCPACHKKEGEDRAAKRGRYAPLPCGHEWFHGDPFVVGGCTRCCNEREEAHLKLTLANALGVRPQEVK